MARKSSTATATDSKAKRDATRAANADINIDFGTTLAADSFARQRSERTSIWTQKLAALRDATDSGDAVVGAYYKLGEFGSTTGARTTLRSLINNPSRVPEIADGYAFDLDTRRTDDGTGSELWGAVIEDAGEDTAEG